MQFGDFELSTFVAKGGMGSVWKGFHRNTNLSVAIKLMSIDLEDSPVGMLAFHNEVNSIAALYHPSIIDLFDYGNIPDDIKQVFLTKIGIYYTNYLVMEFIEHSHLGNLNSNLQKHLHKNIDWSQLKTILMQILSALAYTHSLGVIHLDIKPENILVADYNTLSVKITDFGLAFLAKSIGKHLLVAKLIDTADSTSCMGTPAYMPPEQCYNSYRDFGPWSDLYALGCTIFKVATGKTPFERENLFDTLKAHIEVSDLSFKANFSVPKGFQDWLVKLVNKDINKRFQSAAVAADALDSLSMPLVFFEGNENLKNNNEEIFKHKTPFKNNTTTGFDIVLKDTVISNALEQNQQNNIISYIKEFYTNSELALTSKTNLPLPDKWHYSNYKRSTLARQSTSIKLYEIRSVPLYGRFYERQLFLDLLKSSVSSNQANILIVNGKSGYGKSKLVSWFLSQCHEKGLAEGYFLQYSINKQLTSELSNLVLRIIGCAGLDEETALLRIENFCSKYKDFNDYDVSAIYSLIKHELKKSEFSQLEEVALKEFLSFSFQNQTEKFSFIYRFIKTINSNAPFILWMDDVQWGLEGLEFCRYILQAQSFAPAPILVILTAEKKATSKQHISKKFLDLISHEKRVHLLTLKPLSNSEQKLFLEELVFFESKKDLKRATSISKGNPLLSVQLIAEWIQRGDIKISEKGLTLSDNKNIYIPNYLEELWYDRLTRLCSLLTPSAHDVVILAAVFGMTVSFKEWELACNNLCLPRPILIFEELLKSQFAQPLETFSKYNEESVFWTFTHVSLRERLISVAVEKNLFQKFSLACANTLKTLYQEDHSTQHNNSYEIKERIGNYYANATYYENALSFLLSATDDILNQHQLLQAHRVLLQIENILKIANLDKSDFRWGHFYYLKIVLYKNQGFTSKSLALTSKALKKATKYNWIKWKNYCILEECAIKAFSNYKNLDITNIFDNLSKVYDYFIRSNDIFPAVRALILKISSAQLTGDVELYKKNLHELAPFIKKHGNVQQRSRLSRFIAEQLIDEQDLKSAAIVIEEGMALSEAKSSQKDFAVLSSLKGKVELLQGNKDLARMHFLNALKIFEYSGDSWGIANTIGYWGESEITVEDYKSAIERFEELILKLKNTQLKPMMLAAKINLAIAKICSESNDINNIIQDLRDDIQFITNQQILQSYYIIELYLLSYEKRWDLWDSFYEKLLTLSSIGIKTFQSDLKILEKILVILEKHNLKIQYVSFCKLSARLWENARHEEKATLFLEKIKAI